LPSLYFPSQVSSVIPNLGVGTRARFLGRFVIWLDREIPEFSKEGKKNSIAPPFARNRLPSL